MSSCEKCHLPKLIRLPGLMVIALGALAVSGCPGSNYSNPALASPQDSQAIVVPPATEPPADQNSSAPPITAPPPARTTPAPPVTSMPVPTAMNSSFLATAGIARTGTLTATGTGTLVYSILVPPVAGSAKLTDPSTGAFTYTAPPSFSGVDHFQFTVTDSAGTSAPATVTVTVSPPALGALSATANLAINVEGVSYYDVAQQYVDIMRMAGDWLSTASDTVNGANQTLQKIGKLDANGWPTEDAIIMMVSGGVANGSAADAGPDSYLLGKYQLSFNGIARLYNNGGSVQDQHYDAATNTTTATLIPTPLGTDGTNAQVRVGFSQTQRTASSPVNTGVTNVHVIRPQFAPNGMKWWDSPTQEFTNPFLASLAPFSTLRFMDWTGTNGSQQADWSERKPADFSGRYFIQTNGAWEWNATDHKTELTDNWWSLLGQSWESVIDLANATGKDIWINIPVRASDDYVRNLATLLKQNLKAGIHVYVEYSNEIWNFMFEQYYYNDAATTALLANSPTAAAAYQKSCISWANDTCHSAERLMQIANDFAGVWGPQAINTSIRPVFCWQTGSAAMQIALGYIKETYGPPANYFYGVCSAPYWAPATITDGESTDDLFAAAAASIPSRDGSLLVYTVAARYYGLHNFTYEGGPGMSGDVDVSNIVAANADPRMGQQVTQALTGAFQNGVDMYTYYASSGGWGKYGSWGATNDIFDLAQPKWQALQALKGQSIKRTLAVADPQKGPRPGATLPGSIDAGKPAFGVIGGTFQAGAKTTGGFCIAATNGLPDMCMLHGDKPGGNTQYGYMVVVPQAGSYSVALKLDNRNTIPAASAQLYVNQQAAGGQVAISAAPAGKVTNPAAFTITLPAGISLIELEATSGYFGIDSIVVTATN